MIAQRKLGPYEVSAIGMGCMPLSFPNERNPNLINEPDRAISFIHAALDGGITLLDTADVIDVCNQYGIAFLPWSPLGGASSFSKIATGELGVFNKIAELNQSCPPNGPLEGELLDLPKFRD